MEKLDLGQVRLVEIELFSYCNRKCGWCPNKDIDRRGNPQYLPEDVYLNILDELKEAGYQGAITYSRYNEPMSNSQLLKKRTRQAKEKLPGVKLVTNTNGDYVTAHSLNGLAIDELSIMDYDMKGMDHGKLLFANCGIEITEESYPFLYGIKDSYMSVLYYADWPKHHLTTYRGGNLSHANKQSVSKLGKRTAACLEPTFFIGIDYTGDVVPCCEIRGDSLLQKPYVLGNVKEQSLHEIFFSEKAIGFRTATAAGKFSGPCTYCTKVPGRYTSGKGGLKYKNQEK